MDRRHLLEDQGKFKFTQLFFQDCFSNTLADETIKVLEAKLLSDTSAEKVSYFKYDDANQIILEGIWRYHLTIEQQGQTKQIDVIVKIKPKEDKTFAIYQKILDECQIKLTKSLSDYLRHTEYAFTEIKEPYLFSHYQKQLQNYIPLQYGIYMDRQHDEYVRIEEIFNVADLAGTADDISNWNEERMQSIIKGLAHIHSVWLNNTHKLKDEKILLPLDTENMLALTELWQKYLDFIVKAYPDLVTQDRYQFHQQCINTIPIWTNEASKMPQTVIYYDCNPKNLAFRQIDHQLIACFYDWERAMIGLPQMDLAELFCYVLPENFSQEQMENGIEQHRNYLSQISQQTISSHSWRKGFKLALYFLLMHRLPLHLAVQHAFGDRPYVIRAYKILQRMLGLMK